jgi:hypothetical protein
MAVIILASESNASFSNVLQDDLLIMWGDTSNAVHFGDMHGGTTATARVARDIVTLSAAPLCVDVTSASNVQAIVAVNTNALDGAGVALALSNASGAFSVSLVTSGGKNVVTLANDTGVVALSNTSTLISSNLCVNGYLGVATSSPAYPVHVNANSNGISIFAASDIAAYSDARDKHDIVRIDNALARLKAIGGYTYIPTHAPGTEGRRHAGVLAQEVRAQLPEVVHELEGGRLSVAYGNLSALLVEATKELSDATDAAIQRLDAAIQKLEVATQRLDAESVRTQQLQRT